MKSRLISQIQLGMIALLLSLSGCRAGIPQLHPQYALPTVSTKILQEITKVDPERIEEIGTLSGSNVGEKIIVMAQLDSTNMLTAVYGNGDIRLWDIPKKDFVLEYNVGLVSPEATSFSVDGLSLITPNNVSVTSTESEYETVTVIDGINLWDTETGTQIGCFGSHCQPQREQYNSVTIGAALSPKGDWLIKYAQTTLYFINIPGQKPNVILDLDNPDNNDEQHISRLSFDPSGEYYSVAYEEGNVTVYEFERAMGNDNWSKMLSLGKVQEIRHPVLSQKIDPTRTWLALLYEDNLRIWDLRSARKNPSISLAIPSMTTIAFDQSGNLLVVGTKSGLRFIDLQQKSEVAYFANNEVSSVFITTDNRLLVWSDTNGIIHLWGATIP